MNYMVMECHPGYVVLLDEEGRFFKAANFNYEVGQTVCDPEFMRDTNDARRKFKILSRSIAAIAACLILVLGISRYQNYVQPYSYIYMTINPEVRMELNREGTVVGLIGINEDGQTLIEGYDGTGKDKITVADELIDRAIEMGFLYEGGQIAFSIDSPDEELYTEYSEELQAQITQYLDGRIEISIKVEAYGAQDDTVDEENYRPIVVTVPPQNVITYNDTDYGDTIATLTPTPAPTTPVPTQAPEVDDSNYDPEDDSDYSDGDTDYDPGNVDDDYSDYSDNDDSDDDD